MKGNYFRGVLGVAVAVALGVLWVQTPKYSPLGTADAAVTAPVEELPKAHVVENIDSFAALWADATDAPKSQPFLAQGTEEDPPTPIVVHLTFDDGPGPETDDFLDLLDRYGIKATFFVNSNRINRRQETTRRIVLDGHAIANHTHSHCSLENPDHLEPEEVCGARSARAEIEDTQRIVAEVTGVEPTCFRPPFGAQSGRTKALVASYGLETWIWDLDTKDWQLAAEGFDHAEQDAVDVLNSIPSYAATHRIDNVVVLAHDGTPSAPVMLEILSNWLEENADRYVFEPLEGC